MADRTTIELKRDTWKELHARKEPGDSFDDVVNDLIEIPNEYRIDCGACGFDGGTYDYFADPDPPAYCPKCGESAEENEDVRIIPAEDEPTALSWRPERRL